MSKVLTPESVATRPDAGYFSPERLAMLKRIFDAVCKAHGIVAKDYQDDLAVNLLVASKLNDDESALVAFLNRKIADNEK